MLTLEETRVLSHLRTHVLSTVAEITRVCLPDGSPDEAARILTTRDHRIVEDLMLGERTLDVAGKYGLSPARISQKRREFRQDWRSYCGEDVSTSRPHRPGVA